MNNYNDNEKELNELKEKVARLERRRSAMGYEYKSKTEFHGWPLVHIIMGYGSDPEHPKFVARGIVAVGNIAIGVFAMGGLAIGFFTFAGVGLGLLSFAGVALGGIALGGVSIGWLAMGGLAIGHIAIGGMAIGHYAFGGNAIGEHCVSPRHSDPVAIGFIRAKLGSFGNSLIELFRHARHGRY